VPTTLPQNNNSLHESLSLRLNALNSDLSDNECAAVRFRCASAHSLIRPIKLAGIPKNLSTAFTNNKSRNINNSFGGLHACVSQ
jgi:hypothetical protein